jgi:hypothetical protein
MEKAEARRLQPYFVRSFFMKAFQALGGTIYPREADRFEVTHVPASIRERDRLITGRNRRDLAPVLKRYERVCFTREAVRPVDKPGAVFAAMLHPGHPAHAGGERRAAGATRQPAPARHDPGRPHGRGRHGPPAVPAVPRDQVRQRPGAVEALAVRGASRPMARRPSRAGRRTSISRRSPSRTGHSLAVCSGLPGSAPTRSNAHLRSLRPRWCQSTSVRWPSGASRTSTGPSRRSTSA